VRTNAAKGPTFWWQPPWVSMTNLPVQGDFTLVSGKLRWTADAAFP
jgi:hypothetical protein